MKILLVGDSSDRWVKEYVEKVLLGNCEVIIASIHSEKYREWYSDNDISICELRDKSSFFSRIPIIRTIWSLKRLRNYVCNCKADIVLCIYSNWMIQLALGGLKNHNIIYWYIGSDLLRMPKFFLRMTRSAVYEANDVIVINREMKEFFYREYPKYHERVNVIDFGYSHLDNIDRNSDSNDVCRNSSLGSGVENKIVVVVGYNADKNQQVDKVFAGLKSLTQQVKQKICLIIPMQYGSKDAEYVKRIKKIAFESGLDYRVLTEYYDADKMAQFVKATDVFINSQTTDAMSAALVEHLYGNSIVLNAEWLKYTSLNEREIFYCSFSSFGEIADLLNDVIENYHIYKAKSAENHERMKGAFSWGECRRKFDELMNRYVSD